MRVARMGEVVMEGERGVGDRVRRMGWEGDREYGEEGGDRRLRGTRVDRGMGRYEDIG